MLFPLTPSRRPVVHDETAPYIRFEGDWIEAEKRILQGAISDAEGLDLPVTAREYVPGPWMCYCKRLAGMTAYIAHRSGWTHVLHAYGAAELGLKILFVGGRPPKGSRGFTA